MQGKKNENLDEAPLMHNVPEGNNNGNFFDSIVDEAKLCKKPNLSNSELILSILDVCLCIKKFTPSNWANTTKNFWVDMVEDSYCKIIFKGYKSETLRKYWLIMRSCGDESILKKLVNFVKANSALIDDPSLKLKNSIDGVSLYIKNNENKPLKDYFSDYFHRNFDAYQETNATYYY